VAATGCQGEGLAATECQGEGLAATGCQGKQLSAKARGWPAATGCQGKGMAATGRQGKWSAASDAKLTCISKPGKPQGSTAAGWISCDPQGRR